MRVRLIRSLAMSLASVGLSWSMGSAFAADSADRCVATASAAESRLIACVARCRDRAERYHAKSLIFDESGCELHCEGRYDRSLTNAVCPIGPRVELPPPDREPCDGPLDTFDQFGHCIRDGQRTLANPVTMHGILSFPWGEEERELEVVNGRAILEGDIIVGRVEDIVQPGQVRPESAAITTLGTLWPGGVVPYVVNPFLAQPNRAYDAIAHWQANTSLRFVQRTTQADYVEFVTGTDPAACYSSRLGHAGGRQTIELSQNCSTGNTIHEIGHAVGLLHEQTRADRDQYVRILFGNIIPGRESQFAKYSASGIQGRDLGPFDFQSIMLYDSFAFSFAPGYPTIIRLDGSTYSAQRDHLSTGDRNGIAHLYNVTPPPTSRHRTIGFQGKVCVVFNGSTGEFGLWQDGKIVNRAGATRSLFLRVIASDVEPAFGSSVSGRILRQTRTLAPLQPNFFFGAPLRFPLAVSPPLQNPNKFILLLIEFTQNGQNFYTDFVSFGRYINNFKPPYYTRCLQLSPVVYP